MPWSGSTFKKKHNHSLNPGQADMAARVANSVLKRTGDDAKAVRIGNAAARRAHGVHGTNKKKGKK